MASPITADTALAAWQRQLQRRRQGVPTLSVVAGSPNLVRQLVRCWAESNQLPVCESSGGDLDSLAAEWFASLADSRHLLAAAMTWLSARAGLPLNELTAAFAARSEAQQALFFERMFGAVARLPEQRACRAIIEHQAQRGSTSAGLWERLRSDGDDAEAVCGGLLSLMGTIGCPVLHAMPPTSETFLTTIDALTRLVSAAPGLVAFVFADTAWLMRYLDHAAESRPLALVREGLVVLDASVDTALAAAGAVLLGGRCSPIASATAGDGTPKSEARPADRARSEAERYLFARLQSHPDTAGLFELNGRVELADGGWWEVDLLGRDVRIAIEIDGYYHFTDLDAYRRDRRKDVSLQQAGYLVVRCLADDVVSRLEDIVNLVLGAVRSRPLTRHRSTSREEPTP